MPYRSYSRRMPYRYPRRRRKVFAIRDFVSQPAPTTRNTFNLLGTLMTDFGGTLNLPEFTIRRIRLRISITWKFSGTSVGSGDGFFTAVYVDSRNQTPLTPEINAYDQTYQMWTFEPATKFLQQGAADFVINSTDQRVAYMEYDIKSMRKLRTLNDTEILQIDALGGLTLQNINYWLMAHASIA